MSVLYQFSVKKKFTLKEANISLISQNLALQNEQKTLSEKTLFLELSLKEKNQEVEEMKNMLGTKMRGAAADVAEHAENTGFDRIRSALGC
jgi:hypothetical protein